MSWVKFSGYGDDKPEWADERDETLYILAVGDLEDVLNQLEGRGAWDNLSSERKAGLIDSVRESLERWAGNSNYSWPDVMEEAMKEDGRFYRKSWKELTKNDVT